MGSLFSSQPELTIFAFYFQDGEKRVEKKIDVLKNKLTYFDSQIITYYYKRSKFYPKLNFWSGYFRAITAYMYVGEI